MNWALEPCQLSPTLPLRTESSVEKKETDDSRAAVEVPLNKERVPCIAGTSVLSWLRFWRSAYWINVCWRPITCWALPVNLKMKAAGLACRAGSGGWEKWTSPRACACLWCCDLNPGLSESQVHIHLPSLTESWIQKLIFPPNKEQNVDRTWMQKESSTHDYRVGKEDLESQPLCYRNLKILLFLSPTDSWDVHGEQSRMWEDREGQDTCKHWFNIQGKSLSSTASPEIKARGNEIDWPQGVFTLDIQMDNLLWGFLPS